MKKLFEFSSAIIIVIFVGLFCGPVIEYDEVDNKPASLNVGIEQIADYVKDKESNFSNIKTNNQAQILWADSIIKTEYSVVYLHGFTASKGEAFPIIQNFSQQFNCNTYLSRLSQHGLKDEDAFLDLTPQSLVESAKQAIAIGRILGEKVILMSTSTGGTLSTYLAINDPDVYALIMLSPNFDLHDSNSKLLTWPWGKQLMRQISGGDFRYWNNKNEKVKEYWTTKNRIEGYIALRDLLNQTMTGENFSQLTIPYFIGYYYKDENEFDKVISVDAIESFTEQARTPDNKRRVVAFGNAVGHVIGSEFLNPNWMYVQTEIFDFTSNILKLSDID